MYYRGFNHLYSVTIAFTVLVQSGCFNPTLKANTKTSTDSTNSTLTTASVGAGYTGTGKGWVTASGDVYIADTLNHVIRKVSAGTGIITTVVGTLGVSGYTGDGGLATAARLNSPVTLVIDSAENLYISDMGNAVVRKVTFSTGIITTIAGNPLGTLPPGYLGGLATNARFPGGLFGIALSSSEDLYIAQYNTGWVLKVDRVTGIITRVAGNLAMTRPYSGDGGLATSTAMAPFAITLDTLNNLYISDPFNYRVLKVDGATQIVTTIAGTGVSGTIGNGGLATAARVNFPIELSIDSLGNIYFCETYGYVIRKITVSTGIISVVAGNGTSASMADGTIATAGSLRGPEGLFIDSANNIYISDVGDLRVRRVSSSTNTISTIAGDGTLGSSGDGGLGPLAKLRYPFGYD